MEQSSSHREAIEHQFDSFCKKLLKNETRNHLKEINRRHKNEIFFSEMTKKKLNQLITIDKYDTDRSKFTVCEFEIKIENDLLAEALLMLNEKNRDILLLSYFEGMSDTEISIILKMIRRTVQYRRTSSLNKLNEYMGGKSNAGK